jgi:hypothetical protein
LPSSRAAAILKAVEISGGFPGVLIPVFVPDKSSCDGFELAGRGVLWILREREREALRYEYLAVQIGSFLGRSLATGFSSKKGNR